MIQKVQISHWFIYIFRLNQKKHFINILYKIVLLYILAVFFNQVFNNNYIQPGTK